MLQRKVSRRDFVKLMAQWTVGASLTGVGGYVLLYHRENGNRVTDVVELDAAGRAARVRAYYAAEQP